MINFYKEGDKVRYNRYAYSGYTQADYSKDWQDGVIENREELVVEKVREEVADKQLLRFENKLYWHNADFFELVKETFEMGNKEIVGYKVLIPLPDIKVGEVFKKSSDMFKYTGGETPLWKVLRGDIYQATTYTEVFLEEHKDWFAPIYKVEAPILITNGEISILVSDKIVAEGKTIDVDKLRSIVSYAEKPSTYTRLNEWNVDPVKIPEWKIGCSIFTLDKLKEIVNAYDKWNK